MSAVIRRGMLASAITTLLVLGVLVSQAFAYGTYSKSTTLSPGWILYCTDAGCAPFYPLFTELLVVGGQDSAAYPGKIWIDYHRVSGLIKNFNAYPFSQYVTVNWGEFREAALPNYIVDHSFYQSSLTPITDWIYDPADKPWQGGTQSTSFYMNASVDAWDYVSVQWSGYTTTWSSFQNVTNDFTFHTIYGWQNQ